MLFFWKTIDGNNNILLNYLFKIGSDVGITKMNSVINLTYENNLLTTDKLEYVDNSITLIKAPDEKTAIERKRTLHKKNTVL